MLTKQRICQIGLIIVTFTLIYAIIKRPVIHQRILSVVTKDIQSAETEKPGEQKNTGIVTQLEIVTKAQVVTTNAITTTTKSPNIKNPLIVYTTNPTESFTSAKLRYSKGQAQMYVYNSGDLISRSILTSGSWEGGYIAHMESWFDKIPDLNLVDIGCNLGVYSIVAGMRGRKSVAVDANIDNIKRLRKSLVDNKIDDKVTLIYNGIADVYSKFAVSSPEAGNIGHSLLVKPGAQNSKIVTSVVMDDLLEVIKFKKAIMKIDIEGHEFDAFHKADKLFTEVDFIAVMMEWAWIGKNKNQNIPVFVKNFFIRFGYKAYPHLLASIPLSPEAHTQWPWDIVWKKSVSP